MEKKTVLLIVIAILVIALAALGLYIANNDSGTTPISLNTSDILKVDKNDTNTTVNKTAVENTTNATTNSTNETVVGDASPRENVTNNTNSTYKVYNPQSDSYVPVVGEKFDEEVNRWYTYDTDGVRYYNTRINTN